MTRRYSHSSVGMVSLCGFSPSFSAAAAAGWTGRGTTTFFSSVLLPPPRRLPCDRHRPRRHRYRCRCLLFWGSGSGCRAGSARVSAKPKSCAITIARRARLDVARKGCKEVGEGTARATWDVRAWASRAAGTKTRRRRGTESACRTPIAARAARPSTVLRRCRDSALRTERAAPAGRARARGR